MNRDTIIKAVDEYSAAHGLKPSTICQYALKNRHFYSRVKSGGNFGFATAEKLLKWLAQNDRVQP